MRRLLLSLTVLLPMLAPLGTRYIWRYGQVQGTAVEWGTVSLYGTQILTLALIAVGLLAAGRTVWRQRLPSLALLAAAILAVAAAVSVSLASTGDLASSLVVLLWLLLGAGLLISLSASRPSPVWILSGLAVGAGFQATLALWQFFRQSIVANKWLGLAAQSAASLGTFVVETADGRWLRAYGTLGHPNLLGFYLVIGLVAAVALLLRVSNRYWRLALWSSLPLLGAGLTVSFSKSALLAAFAAAVVMPLVLSLAKRGQSTRIASAAFAAAFLAALALSFAVPQLVQTRFTAAGRLETRSWEERLSLTDDALKLIAARPFFGVGPGLMPLTVSQKWPDSRTPYAYQPAHNVPLLVAAETGWLGLLAWAGLLLGLIAGLLVRIRKLSVLKRDDRLWLPACGLSLMAALLTVAAFDHFLWSLWPGQLAFWLVLSLAFLGGQAAVDS